nr:tyrosine-type recombinase/integrase [Nocardia farcinica]
MKVGRIPDSGGWRVHGAGSEQAKAAARAKQRGAKAGYVDLHSVVDGYSRLAYTEAPDDEKADTAIRFLHRARAILAAHGIGHIHRIVCYRAHDFVKVLRGTRHQRIRPYTPRLDGKAERYQRILAEEFLDARTWTSKLQRSEALKVWGRVMEQAVRDEMIDRNPVQVSGCQRQFAQVEDELEDPRALALPDWQTLTALADALVAASADNYRGWGDVVLFVACTATRIGEVSGCRVTDIDVDDWVWTLGRQTTPGPGGMQNKGTKDKRARKIPFIAELRPLVSRRTAAIGYKPEARLFVCPRGGRISTGVLRRATHWDDVVVAALGYEHLRRHGLRHTGLTWFADAGVSVHRLQKIAGHRDPRINERYLHPDIESLQDDGNLLWEDLPSHVVPNSVGSANDKRPSDAGRWGFLVCRAARI